MPQSPRPQEPKPPFPYRSIEVRYDNPTTPGVTLAGTLTLPAGKGPAPAVLLISGSGQNERDIPYLNHMFQTARTGLMEEAEIIEETFAPTALQLIGDWITKRVRK